MTAEFANFMNDFWDQYDVDKNGTLDKQEFRKFVQEVYLDEDMPESALDEEKFEQIFWEFDTDQNGSISKSEMFDFLASMFGVTATQIDFAKVEALME
jgi:Ca2+-binding EF-hand superfamily protein